MHESVIQRRYVREECPIGCKPLSSGRIMMLPEKEVPANSVPAAAVIQRVRALIGITGRKARVGGYLSQM